MLTSKTPLVSAIVLTFNSSDYITACLESIFAQSYPAIEVLVIDNASKDNSRELARAAMKTCLNDQLIVSERNLGFAGGMNLGARAAKGTLILFLNADLILDNEYITRAVAAYQETHEQSVGIVGGQVFRWINGKKTEELDSGPILLRKRFSHTIAPETASSSMVFGPAGSCPIVSKSLLEDVRLDNGDYFDSDYFMYWEDTDLWFRAQLRGWKCYYAPDAIAWHKRAGSYAGKRRTFQRPLIAQKRSLRNRWVTICKVMPLALLFRFGPFLFLAELLTLAYFVLRSPRSLIAWGQALGEFAQRLPGTLKKRRYIQRNRAVDTRELYGFFTGF